jgi:hypothetical protein
MKTTALITVYCAILVLSSGAARAQDPTRVPDTDQDASLPVDASIHEAVDEPAAKQPQSRQSNKRQQTPSVHWAFQPSNRPPVTKLQSEKSPGLATQRGKGSEQPVLFDPFARSETPPSDIRRPSEHPPLGISSINETSKQPAPHSAAGQRLVEGLNGETGTAVQGFRTKSPIPSPYLRTNAFSSPVREKRVESAGETSLSSPFSKPSVTSLNALKESNKRHSSKSVGRSKTLPPSLGSQAVGQH